MLENFTIILDTDGGKLFQNKNIFRKIVNAPFKIYKAILGYFSLNGSKLFVLCATKP